jgi:hypothetical protein
VYRDVARRLGAFVVAEELPGAAATAWYYETRVGAALLVIGGLCARAGAHSAATAPREQGDAGMMLLIPGLFSAYLGVALLALAVSLRAPGPVRWAGHLAAAFGGAYLALR